MAWLIKEQAGSCRHRAWIFVKLAHLIGIPVLLPDNENHIYCEVPYIDKRTTPPTIKYRQLDFGGAPINDITLPSVRKLSKKESKSSNENKTVLDQEQPPQQLVTTENVNPLRDRLNYIRYKNHFERLQTPCELSSINQLLEKKNNVLILDQDQSPASANAWILQQLATTENFNPLQDHLYIRSAKNFERYLEPPSIIDGKRIIKKDSLLFKLIHEGGVMVVNLTKLTPLQMAIYKSIFDLPPLTPTLFDYLICPKLIRIGLTHKLSKDSSVSTRVIHWQFAKNIDLNSIIQEPYLGEENVKTDLLRHPIWHELLYKIDLNGKRMDLSKSGKLHQALQEQKPLLIANIPTNNTELNELIDLINSEHKFLDNGEWVKVDPKVTIQVITTPIHSPLKLAPSSFEIKNPNFIAISSYNFYTLFFQYFINNADKSITKIPGLLANYQPNTIFSITNTIAENEWPRLFNHIKEHYPKNDFKFQFANQPNKIFSVVDNMENKEEANKDKMDVDEKNTKVNSHEEIGDETSPNKQNSSAVKIPENLIAPGDPLPTNCFVIFSNDPQYFATQQAQKNPPKTIVIDLTRKTFNDLVVKTDYIWNEATSCYDFSYEKGIIWLALEEKTNIILTGTPSAALYTQLIPLLSAKPYILFNGMQNYFENQVLLVAPEKLCETLACNPVTLCRYEQHHYKAAFRKEGLTNADVLFPHIYAFLVWANKLLAKDQEYAPLTGISELLLKQFINTLNSKKRHSNNPIKGLLNYHFKKESFEYSYLNAIAKYFFLKPGEINSMVRIKKSQALVQQLNIDINNLDHLKQHAWKILNCGNGFAIAEILGSNPEDAIDSTGLVPTLKQDALLKLQKTMLSSLQQTTIEAEPTEVPKHVTQLFTLLTDPNTNLIMLKGSPSVGKKYTVKNIVGKQDGFEVYDGLKEIENWLSQQNPMLAKYYFSRTIKMH